MEQHFEAFGSLPYFNFIPNQLQPSATTQARISRRLTHPANHADCPDRASPMTKAASQLISSNLITCPGKGSGARWMHGGTGLPGHTIAMRQRLLKPKENGLAAGNGT